jgi:hypothetical protein
MADDSNEPNGTSVFWTALVLIPLVIVALVSPYVILFLIIGNLVNR